MYLRTTGIATLHICMANPFGVPAGKRGVGELQDDDSGYFVFENHNEHSSYCV